MSDFALRGTVVHTPAPDVLEIRPDSFLVCASGVCQGIFPALPAAWAHLPVTDFGRELIVPGYTDLHLHASQYADLGLGMDYELPDWLERLTFPEEARFADEGYAEKVYTAFTEELRRSFTTNAVVFATIHTPATLKLMSLLERSGLYALVGRVNMDRNCPENVRETDAAAALAETEHWLSLCRGRFDRVAPVLTPRFVPSCSGALMAGLGELAARYRLPVQSHLSENLSEVRLVRELHPECPSYTAVYEKYSLLGADAIMAHCIHLSGPEIETLRRTGTWVAHCPTSNSNVRSGIAPVRRFLDAGLHVGLGSDISGGHTLDMSEVLRHALQVSRLLWRLDEGHPAFLTAGEAFYLATLGGGQFFGDCGAFLPGYRFDALVVEDGGPGAYTPDQRFERFIYRCTARDIRAKYVSGVRLF